MNLIVNITEFGASRLCHLAEPDLHKQLHRVINSLLINRLDKQLSQNMVHRIYSMTAICHLLANDPHK